MGLIQISITTKPSKKAVAFFNYFRCSFIDYYDYMYAWPYGQRTLRQRIDFIGYQPIAKSHQSPRNIYTLFNDNFTIGTYLY